MSWWYENEAEEMKSCEHCSHEDCKNIGGTWYCLECPECGVNWKEKKMEFDKSRVYTSLNADELKQGDKVFVANSLYYLKEQVLEDDVTDEIVSITTDTDDKRFRVDRSGAFALAYLVERAEPKTEPKASEICINCERYSKGYCNKYYKSTRYDNTCPDYLCRKPKTGQMCLNCKHYNKVNDFRDCTSIDNPTGACPHYEAEKYYRPFKDTDELVKVWEKKVPCNGYRPANTMPLIWVRDPKRPKCTYLLNGFVGGEVHWGSYIFNMQELFDNFEFLDGSPCGVEE